MRTAICFALLALGLAGCTPPGPRALLEGKALLDRGRYPEAIERLTRATQLLTTNAQAFNYLGLARHLGGDAPGALLAYRQALRLDRDLYEAHYNLGCLWLDQNRPGEAKSEFTACTLRRGNSFEAWLKLGAAQYRLGEFTAAAVSYQKALQWSANHPEALNGLGLVATQRKRPRDAAQYFNAALKQQPNYGPALLNLATVLHRDLNDPTAAAQKYREYLALQPRSADWNVVSAALQSLETKPLVPARAAITNPPPQIAVKTNEPKPPPPTALVAVKSNPPPTLPKPAPPPSTTTMEVGKVTTQPPPRPALAPPSAPSQPVVRTQPAPTSAPPPPSPRATSTPTSLQQPQTVVVAPQPQIVVVAPQPQTVVVAPPKVTTTVSPAPVVTKKSPPPEKRSFISKVNPFSKNPKPGPKPTPLPPTTVVADATPPSPAPSAPPPSQPEQTVVRAAPATAPLRSFPRYTFLKPAAPPPGNRAAADTAFARGARAQAAQKLAEAAQAFQQAAQADGSFFEAHYSLGRVQYLMRAYAPALPTWERALAVRPDSADARYMFAVTLNAAGYVMDATAEAEKILATNPNDARAHLVLGKLCAEEFRDTARARRHYLRVLELDERNPNATDIRYWLVANPG